MRPSLTEFTDACNRVIHAANFAEDGAMIKYAASYARAGLVMHDREEVRVQALYILSNLGGWRGADARATKDVLKQFTKKEK